MASPLETQLLRRSISLDDAESPRHGGSGNTHDVTGKGLLGLSPLEQDQLLDVYEDADQRRPVGTQKSKLVHSNALLHRTVYAFVFSPEGKLLLCRRPRDAAIQPDRWDTTHTHVLPGESPVTALTRQLGLDFGLTAEELQARVVGPLGPPVERTLTLEEGTWVEHELAEAFRVDAIEGTHPGGAALDSMFLPLGEVAELCSSRPHEVAEWLREELQALNWFADAPSGSPRV